MPRSFVRGPSKPRCPAQNDARSSRKRGPRSGCFDFWANKSGREGARRWGRPTMPSSRWESVRFRQQKAFNACPTYKKRFLARFAAWLRERYGSQEKLQAAWEEALRPGETLAEGSIVPQLN